MEHGNRIPYRLPELLDSDRSEALWIVEGEKCADRLAVEGEAVTTASEGVGKWKLQLNEWFCDRIVWILPDADDRVGRMRTKWPPRLMASRARSRSSPFPTYPIRVTFTIFSKT